MESDSWMRVILLVFLTMGAAYCAGSEISYAAMNKLRIRRRAEDGNKPAISAMYIVNNFDQALTTLLISNNLMNISFGTVAALIAMDLWGVGSVKYVTILTAVFVFFFNEMIPKNYARANSENFALAVSGSLRLLMRILSPVAFLFVQISQQISKQFPECQDPEITEEELYDIFEAAQIEGVLDESEHELVHSTLHFDVTTAGDILTHNDKITALNIHASHDEILQIIKGHKFSRLPVYEDSMDNIIGVLHVRRYLKTCIAQEGVDIRSALLEPHYTGKEIPIDHLLQEMSSKKSHMCIVRDEAKKTLGIVTVEDILEELVGEIWDENDTVLDVQATIRDSGQDLAVLG
jgi:CBS domain containing-hemolysin-like protein